MIREALGTITERRIKTQGLPEIQHAYHKKFMEFARKNYKSWWEYETQATQDEIQNPKMYLEYIISMFGAVIKQGIVHNDDGSQVTVDLRMEIDINLLESIMGDYSFTSYIIDWVVDFDLNTFFKKRGWYVSNNYSEYGEIGMVIHANYDEIIKAPRYVYHVLPAKYVQEALKKGLKARSGNKLTTDLPRVYVALGIQDANNIKEIFTNWELWGKNLAKSTDRSILIIDTTKLRKGTKFHKDTDFLDAGAWTYTNIPASAIELYEK